MSRASGFFVIIVLSVSGFLGSVHRHRPRMLSHRPVRRHVPKALGKALLRTDNRQMSDEPDQKGFQFPGVFEITAVGLGAASLEQMIQRELVAAGLVILDETVRVRESSGGRYVSVSLSFHAITRADYEAAHEALRAHPDVKWTL